MKNLAASVKARPAARGGPPNPAAPSPAAPSAAL